MGKKFKGTKGKWEYHLISSNASVYHCIKSKDGKTICLISLKEHLYSEVECNAQLVAAAPELLGALIELVEVFNREKLSQSQFQSKAIEQAEKAINKALGL